MAQDLGMDGAGQLGAALGGARLLRREAYNQRMNELSMAFARAAEGQSAMATAGLRGTQDKLAKEQLAAQQQYEDALVASGIPQQRAHVMAIGAAAAGFKNLNTINQGLGRVMILGGADSANLTNDAMSAGVPIFKSAGGVNTNQFTGQSTANPVGNAVIALDAARAAEARAQGGAADALAGQRGRATPGARGSASAKPPKALNGTQLKLLGDVFANAADGSAPSGPVGTITPKGVQDMNLNDMGYSMADLASRNPVTGTPFVKGNPIPVNPNVTAAPWHPISGPITAGVDPSVEAAVHAAAANLPGGAPAPAPTPQSPYKEGTMLRGRDGHIYQVRGGVPVPMP